MFYVYLKYRYIQIIKAMFKWSIYVLKTFSDFNVN